MASSETGHCPTPLFWRRDYVELQDPSAALIGVDWNDRIQQSASHTDLRTWIAVELRGADLRSPCRATFGGFYSQGNFIHSDIERIIAWLSARNRASRLKIYLPPNYLLPFDSENQLKILKGLGAQISFTDLNFHIPTTSWSTQSLSKGNRKKLRQWNEAGGVVERVGIERLPDIYEIFEANRTALGVTPSISLADLSKLIGAFSEDYQLYVGRLAIDLAAVAVLVRVTNNTNYVFIWADRITYRHLSPVVALCEHLVSVSRYGGVDVLDLGTASVQGVTNHGLARFKQNLGAVETYKYFVDLPLVHWSGT